MVVDTLFVRFVVRQHVGQRHATELESPQRIALDLDLFGGWLTAELLTQPVSTTKRWAAILDHTTSTRIGPTASRAS